MEYYKVLLVDDEDDIREGMKRKMNWNDLGFEVVGTAENGQDAIEKVERLKPDVVMTDIKMPFMDGLTLCKKIREQMAEPKIIIFSGFDDFEYAQKAIQYHVDEYIVKPIDTTKLSQVLIQLKASMDEEIKEKRDVQKLRVHYKESLPILKEKFLLGLLEGKIEEEKIQELNALYEMKINGNNLIVGVAGGESKEREKELISYSIKQLLDERFSEYCYYESFVYLDYVVFIAKLEDEKHVFDLLQLLNQICDASSRLLQIHTTIGLGSVCKKAAELSTSFEHAKNALDYRILLGSGKAIFIEDVEPASKTQFSLEEQDVKKLIRAIKLGGQQDIRVLVTSMIEQLAGARLTLQQYQLYVIELISELFKFGRGNQLRMEDIFGADLNFYQTIFQIHSLQDLGEWVYEICCRLNQGFVEERKDTVKIMAETAKQYVEEHYSDSELSIDTICQHLHVSSAYFSSVFKRETGMSFITYLTKVRMEEAMHLLDTTDAKTYVISSKVGYAEPNYFSYVFRKQYGISPTKYRMSKIGES